MFPPRSLRRASPSTQKQARYWTLIERYYDGGQVGAEGSAKWAAEVGPISSSEAGGVGGAPQAAAAAGSPYGSSRLFEQHHLCAAQQREYGWAKLHGGARDPPAEAALKLSFIGVEGSGHHMTSFLTGAVWQALNDTRAARALNASVLITPSFPYNARFAGKAGKRGGHYKADGKFAQRYLSRTDRTVVDMWPFDRVWRGPQKGWTVEDRVRDPHSLFVVLARDPVRAALANLARFYHGMVTAEAGTAREAVEVAPYSDQAFELELRQQAVAHSHVELLARSVPCGRLFLLPFELMLEDACSAVDALWHFLGRGEYLPRGGASHLRHWINQTKAYFAAPYHSNPKRDLLRWDACRREDGRIERLLSLMGDVENEEVLDAVRRCEAVLSARAAHYFARLRFMWPLQMPHWRREDDPLGEVAPPSEAADERDQEAIERAAESELQPGEDPRDV